MVQKLQRSGRGKGNHPDRQQRRQDIVIRGIEDNGDARLWGSDKAEYTAGDWRVLNGGDIDDVVEGLGGLQVDPKAVSDGEREGDLENNPPP